MERKRLRTISLGALGLAVVLSGCSGPLAQASSQTPEPVITMTPTPEPAKPLPPVELELEREISLIAREYYYWYQIEDGTLMRWDVDESYRDRRPVFENAASVWGAMYGVVVLDQDGGLWVNGSPNVVLSVDYESDEWTYLLPNVVSVRCGLWHGLALQSDGSLWTWGHNDSGQLGNGELGEGPRNYPPQKILGGVRYATSFAVDESLAVTGRNELLAWGEWDGGVDLNGQTQPLLITEQLGGLAAEQVADYAVVSDECLQILDTRGAIHLVELDAPDRSTVAVESGVSAIFDGGYRTEEGETLLWFGDDMGVKSLGTGMQQTLYTGDGILLLRENGALSILKEDLEGEAAEYPLE